MRSDSCSWRQWHRRRRKHLRCAAEAAPRSAMGRPFRSVAEMETTTQNWANLRQAFQKHKTTTREQQLGEHDQAKLYIWEKHTSATGKQTLCAQERERDVLSWYGNATTQEGQRDNQDKCTAHFSHYLKETKRMVEENGAAT